MFALLFLSESRGARVKRETISWEILSYTLVPSSPSLVFLLAELSRHREPSGEASSCLPEPENTGALGLVPRHILCLTLSSHKVIAF